MTKHILLVANARDHKVNKKKKKNLESQIVVWTCYRLGWGGRMKNTSQN